MGTVDTVMLTHAGDAAVSGVSLVDSINKLIIFLLSALAAGGTVVCSQQLGHGDKAAADTAGKQVILSVFSLSVIIAMPCIVFRGGLLSLIFGTVEQAVMANARVYFLITALSYPFIALFYAGSSIFRASGNSALPMRISVISNVMNIAGNAIAIFALRAGVMGAAVSTLVSYIFSAIVMMVYTTKKGLPIEVGNLLGIRPDKTMIKRVLAIGVPAGVENAMLQFGKLIVQSTVSTLGTAAIAANAMVTTVETFTSMPSQGIGLGLLTIVGTCIGAGKVEEAEKYCKKLTGLAFLVLFFVNWGGYFCARPLMGLTGMTKESAELACSVLLFISILKPFLWPLAFVPENGMRAAGDGKFVMTMSSVSMWVFRVGMTWYLCRCLNVGLMGIWYGWLTDWLFRDIAFSIRFKSGKWKK